MPTAARSETCTTKERRTGYDGLWRVNGFDPRLVKILTALGFAIPAVGYLVLLQHYQVNAVFGDQWDDVVVIHRSFMDFPDWSSLWKFHNHDNRVLFPNLIVIALAHTARFNIDVEEYLSAAMLFTATAILIWAHRRRTPAIPLLFYCPVAILMLSICQWQNTLWGFQMAWYMVLLSLAATIHFLDRPRLSWPFLVVAAAVATVGSYSSLQGLLIWPVGLVLLYHRRRPRSMIVSWIAYAIFIMILYFYNFAASPDDSPQHVLLSPFLAIKFFLFALGDIVGLQRGGPGSINSLNLGGPANGLLMTFGIVIFVLAILVLLSWGIRRDAITSAPIGIALIVYGLMFDALVTEGRVFYGVWGASQSRYTTYDVLVLVGIYLTVLSRSGARTPVRDDRIQISDHPHWVTSVFHANRIRIDYRIIFGVTLAAIVIQGAFSIPNGLQGSSAMREDYLLTASVTRTMEHESDQRVALLYPGHSAGWIRSQQRVLRQYGLSLYG